MIVETLTIEKFRSILDYRSCFFTDKDIISIINFLKKEFGDNANVEETLISGWGFDNDPGDICIDFFGVDGKEKMETEFCEEHKDASLLNEDEKYTKEAYDFLMNKIKDVCYVIPGNGHFLYISKF